MPITVEQGQELVSEFCRIYPAALQLQYKVRATQEEAIHEAATIERAGRILGAYFPVRRCAAFAVSNFRDESHFRRTLRHEIIGHFGINTFTPGEKRALLTSFIEAKDQPGISRLWSSIEKHYAGWPESIKAEEVFCFACETIEPHTPSNNIEAERSLRAVVLDRSRLMELHDLEVITISVADGFKNRTRFQQTFPATDNDQWSREGN